MSVNNILNNRAAEGFLGLGLGFGFLTSLRFVGPVGVPEILVLLGLLSLVLRRPKGLLSISSPFEKFIKIYFLGASLIVLPLATFVVTVFDPMVGSAPQYIISFTLGVLLMFWLADAIRCNAVDMRNLTIWFAVAFFFANILAIFIFGYGVGGEEVRYTGGAKNPNQLTFYAATFTLLLVVYARKLSYYLIPLVVFLVYKAGSDAYYLALIIALVSYIFFATFFSGGLSFTAKICLSSVVFLLAIFGLLYQYLDVLLDFWMVADEGGTRLALMENGFLAAMRSPLFGFGAGSFSGLYGPFEGAEAHNTFLDLAMQFGFIYPIILYGVMVGALLSALRRKEFLVAAFIVGFIESGLFHFSGRHFTFWVEMAVFLNYIFPSHHSLKSRLKRVKAFPGGSAC